MDFLNMSFDSPSDYKKFIKKHKYKKTKRSYWTDIADKGKKVIAYSECVDNEEWKEIYFEFVDSDLNIYVDFFNKETEEWIESYVFYDDELAWTIQCDNHIVSFSGGKDSTAMLLRMLEENMQIDEIIFCDTGKEFPQMYEHIKKVEKYINLPITILKSNKSFDYYMFEHEKTRGKNKGKKGYGWSSGRCRWCTTLLKNQIVDNYLKRYKNEGYIEYIGIAYDEQDRIKNKKYPLVDWKMTEKDCLKYCYDKGFNWSGLYESFDRVSCWCCPLKKIKEYKTLYKNYPELWQELKEMDKKSYNQFRADYSVEQLEEKFETEKWYEELENERKMEGES